MRAVGARTNTQLIQYAIDKGLFERKPAQKKNGGVKASRND
jgi:hypothetical protein